jgi:diguanylate cyclase (GGDEF)-like protein/PAS domain S-box-containing protein
MLCLLDYMAFTLNTYAKFLETIPDAAIVINRLGVLVAVNSQTESLFGYPSNALNGKLLEELLPQSVRPFHVKMVEGYFKNPRTRAMGSGMEISGQYADGHEFPMDVMLKPIEFERELHALCVMRDISAIKAQELQLQQALAREKELALTDYLTGVANVRSFHIALEAEINRFDRFGRPFTLVYLDLDNFKIVNDEKGHAEGDRVLVEVVRVVNGRLRKTDIFSRQGGDEFIILLAETEASLAEEFIKLLQSDLNKAMQKHKWSVTFSLGVLVCLDSVSNAADLIKMTDSLMYEVKKQGKNNVKYSVLGDKET